MGELSENFKVLKCERDNHSCGYNFEKECLGNSSLKCTLLLNVKVTSDNSNFNLKNITQVLNSLGGCLMLLASNNLLKVFSGLKNIINRHFKRRLVKFDDLSREQINTGREVLIYKTKQGVLYSVSDKGLFKEIKTIASYGSCTVYYDTNKNKFSGSILCKSKNRQIHKTDRRTLYKRGGTTNKREINMPVKLKKRCCCTCLPRPICLKTKCQSSEVVSDGKSNVYPLSQTSYASDNHPASGIAQATHHDEDNISYISAIRSQQLDEPQLSLQYSLRFNNSAYHNYEDRGARKLSFTGKWPHPDNFVGVDVMINCGFFYTGKEDLVRCFQCGIGLKDWSATDDPLTEHVRYAPDCQYLNEVIPPTRLREIKASFLPNNVVSTRESHRTDDAGFEPVPDQETVVLPVEPRSPQYARLPVRIASFTKWPQDISQTPEELAEAGFFYTGCNDIVRCYVCDGGLQKWSQGDNAWIEHARWFPHCSYVRVIKGEDFVELVRLSAENEDLEEEGSLQGAAAFSDDISRGISRLNVSEDHKESHTNWDVINKVRDATGIPEEQIRRAIDIMKRAGQNLTEDAVANFLLDKTNQFTESQSFSQKEPESTEELQHENETLKSIVKCMHCRDNDANCLFLPCAHHRLCMACSVSVSTCPVCGKQIYNKVKTFMS